MMIRCANARWVLLIMIALAAAACASARRSSPPTPVANVGALAGTWTGTAEFGAGEQSCTLTIDQGGRATLAAQTVTLNGSVAIAGGKATYDFPGRSSGTITLYETGGKRELNLKGTSGTLDVWVTPK